VFKGMENLLIYATSNRRHLLPEYMSDNQGSRVEGVELHHAEAVEEKISLSDRFGIWLSFYAFPQDDFLRIAAHWVSALAARHGAAVLFDNDARAEALRWALARGGRSGRVAQQFARHWVGSRALVVR
jgi:predicted AAA+ superfamily ATPase